MKKYKLAILLLCVTFVVSFVGCTNNISEYTDAVSITLSNNIISVKYEKNHGITIVSETVYYPVGNDFTFGKDSEKDAHSKIKADDEINT